MFSMSGVEWGEGGGFSIFSALRSCCTYVPWNISSLQLVWSLPVSSSLDRTCISQKGGGIICYCNIFGSSKNIFHFAGFNVSDQSFFATCIIQIMYSFSSHFPFFNLFIFLPSFVVLQYPPGSLLNLQILLPHVAQSHKFPTQYPAKGMSFFF